MTKVKEKSLKLEIQIDDETANGQYVNLAVINHNDEEFVLDCIYVQPQAAKAKVRSRLIMSPRHAKRLMLMLQNNVRSYEEKAGKIDPGYGDKVAEDSPVH